MLFCHRQCDVSTDMGVKRTSKNARRFTDLLVDSRDSNVYRRLEDTERRCIDNTRHSKIFVVYIYKKRQDNVKFTYVVIL